MKLNQRFISTVVAITIALAGAVVTAPAGASGTTAISYYAWDKDGHTYVSTQSQADANAAAAAWNKKNSTSVDWNGFVVWGTCTPSFPPNPKCPLSTSAAWQAGVLRGDAEAGTFWIATSNSGAVFTSVISQADADAKAAADLNPTPTPAYTATSSAGVTYTSAKSQADADEMATFVEHTAMPEYIVGGPNGLVFRSTVSRAAAASDAAAFESENQYVAAAGDYIGFDSSTTWPPGNPADLVLVSGPSQAAADAAAQAWGTRLVRGGVFLASDPFGDWLFVDTSQAGARAQANSYPEGGGNGAPPNFVATSPTGESFSSFYFQQWADNAAAYQYQKPRVLPTSPETCYQGSQSNTLTLLSWQCPAHWTLLKAASTSKAARIAAAKAAAAIRVLWCDSQYGNFEVRADSPKCPAGSIAAKNTVVCVRGKVTQKVTGFAAKCPKGYRTKTK